MAVTVRRVLPRDQAAIARIAETAGLFPAAALPDMIAPALVQGAPDVWLVAEGGDSVAGFAFCVPEAFTDGTWNLRAIGTDPDMRRLGTGSALTTAVEAALRAARARLLVIETSDAPDQMAARAFYAARAFREEARIQDFWGDGVAKIVFSKRLDGRIVPDCENDGETLL